MGPEQAGPLPEGYIHTYIAVFILKMGVKLQLTNQQL